MSVPSCQDCPSFLTAIETVSKFKKNIGAPTCGRFGHVLGRASAKEPQNRQIQEDYARNCTSYGEPIPTMPEEFRFQVMLPDPTTRVQGTNSAINTCAMCTHFIKEDVVVRELGWLAGACAARGKLILSSRQSIEARNCEFRDFGGNRTDISGLHLLPVYENAFSNPGDLKAAYKKSVENFVDPRDYPTDKVVTDEEIEAGIRAWRKVYDPDGSGNSTYLPVYNVEHFSPEEQAKIPKTNDDEHPELYIDHFGGVYLAAVAWSELDETPTLWGSPGTGKTELFRHLAWLMCLPFERISVTAASERDELFGHTDYTPERGTFFTEGRIPLAWKKPCVLCIDEPNTGPVEVWQDIRPMTDNSKQLIVNDVRLPRHTDCYLGFAMNPAWDSRNIGALEIADADANRLFHAYVELPDDALEREIIKRRVHLDGWEITNAQLDLVMAVAKELRGLSDEGTLSVTWAIRPQIKVARAMRWFSPLTAYRRAIGDYLEAPARETILNVVRAHVTD